MKKGPQNYGDPKYWDQRYKETPEIYEWLENYKSLSSLLNQFVQKTDKIINLGCGNSLIQEDMFDDGFESITSVDVSPVVIEQMESRKMKHNRHGLTYQTIDCTDMSVYPDDSFDVAIDKSTLDCLLSGTNSYDKVP